MVDNGINNPIYHGFSRGIFLHRQACIVGRLDNRHTQMTGQLIDQPAPPDHPETKYRSPPR